MFGRQRISLRITLTLKWIQLTLKTDFISLQHLDYEPVQTESPGELIAYYKIASKDISFFYEFYKLRSLCTSFL